MVQDFAPAAAKSLRFGEHYLVYAAQGRMRLGAAGQVWTLPPARAALVRAGEVVDVTVLQALRARSALFHADFVPPTPAPLAVFEVTPLVRTLLLECSVYTSTVEALDEYASAMFLALAHAAWRLASRPSPAVMPEARHPDLRRVLAETEASLVEPPTFSELARRVGVSPRSLSRRFESEMGMTWRECLRRMRMIRAIEYLVDHPENMSVTEIAFEVGYTSSSAFNAAFREFVGCTPSAYRESITSACG